VRKNFLNFDFNFYGPGFEIAKIYQEIYSKRKSENSQRGFGFERAREVDPRVISKIFETK